MVREEIIYVTDSIYLKDKKTFYKEKDKEKEVKDHNWHHIMKTCGWSKINKKWITILNKESVIKRNNSPFGILDCESDGNCFFHCIANALNEKNLFSQLNYYDQNDIRELVAESITQGKYEELINYYKIMKDADDFDEEWDPYMIKSLDDFKFRDSVNALIDLARLGNKFLADTEPWKLIKVEDQKTKVEEIMFISIQICGMLAILSEPFMPFASEKLKSILNLKTSKWTELNISSNIIDSKKLINKPELIFRKIEDEEIERELKKLNNNN